MTVQTYVAVTFDVKHEPARVRPPVSDYSVIAVIRPDGLQYIALFLGCQMRGLFERQRRMSLRHGLRLTAFANVRNGSGAARRRWAESGHLQEAVQSLVPCTFYGSKAA